MELYVCFKTVQNNIFLQGMFSDYVPGIVEYSNKLHIFLGILEVWYKNIISNIWSYIKSYLGVSSLSRQTASLLSISLHTESHWRVSQEEETYTSWGECVCIINYQSAYKIILFLGALGPRRDVLQTRW